MARRRTPATGAPPGAAHPRALFSAAEVAEIRALAAKGWLQREIAELMAERLERPVGRDTIGKVVRGDRYPLD